VTSITDELIVEEDAACARFHEQLHRFDADRTSLERAGYHEAWSVKDLLAHLGSWMAEAATILEQIRMGTHERTPLDVEANNARYHEVWKDVDLGTVRAEFWSSRNRMLEELGRLAEPNRLAQGWFRESGPKHLDEHTPRLREWADEVFGPAAGT
jgi:hypothetical protein